MYAVAFLNILQFPWTTDVYRILFRAWAVPKCAAQTFSARLRIDLAGVGSIMDGDISSWFDHCS